MGDVQPGGVMSCQVLCSPGERFPRDVGVGLQRCEPMVGMHIAR